MEPIKAIIILKKLKRSEPLPFIIYRLQLRNVPTIYSDVEFIIVNSS